MIGVKVIITSTRTVRHLLDGDAVCIITSTRTVRFHSVGSAVSKNESSESNHYIDPHCAPSIGWGAMT